MQIPDNDLRWYLGGMKTAVWPVALAAALALCAAGCASKEPQPDPIREPVQTLLPHLTEVVTGPAAGLLTNLEGYDGQFTISFGASGEDARTVTGQLHVRDGKLCFEPVFKKAKRKSMDSGTFSLIWDAVGKHGYVLSDALQGFAPVTVAADDTKASAGGDSGNPAGWTVERSKDLNGLAVQIQSQDAVRPFTLTLSDIKPGLPPLEIFVPPDGFTSYDSEGALLSELASRQRTVMGGEHRNDGDLGPYQSEPGMQRPGGNAGPGY